MKQLLVIEWLNTNEVEISYLIASNQGSLESLNVIADGQVIETIPLAEDVPTTWNH